MRPHKSNHLPFNWESHARSLERKNREQLDAITELRRQVAALTARACEPVTLLLNVEGQPVIPIPDYLSAALIRDYNAGRELHPQSPRYQSFGGYVVECIKDLKLGVNGLGIHGKGE